MKPVLLFLLLGISGNLVAKTACDDLLVRIGPPKFPTTTAAGPTLFRNGPCSVELSYDLDHGEPRNIKASFKEERCKLFELSAIKALQASEFKSGAKATNCEHTYTYAAE